MGPKPRLGHLEGHTGASPSPRVSRSPWEFHRPGLLLYIHLGAACRQVLGTCVLPSQPRTEPPVLQASFACECLNICFLILPDLGWGQVANAGEMWLEKNL